MFFQRLLLSLPVEEPLASLVRILVTRYRCGGTELGLSRVIAAAAPNSGS